MKSVTKQETRPDESTVPCTRACRNVYSYPAFMLDLARRRSAADKATVNDVQRGIAEAKARQRSSQSSADDIYEICMLLHCSNLNISGNICQTFSYFSAFPKLRTLVPSARAGIRTFFHKLGSENVKTCCTRKLLKKICFAKHEADCQRR